MVAPPRPMVPPTAHGCAGGQCFVLRLPSYDHLHPFYSRFRSVARILKWDGVLILKNVDHLREFSNSLALHWKTVSGSPHSASSINNASQHVQETWLSRDDNKSTRRLFLSFPTAQWLIRKSRLIDIKTLYGFVVHQTILKGHHSSPHRVGKRIIKEWITFTRSLSSVDGQESISHLKLATLTSPQWSMNG